MSGKRLSEEVFGNDPSNGESGEVWWSRSLKKCTGCKHFRRGIIPECKPLPGVLRYSKTQWASSMRAPWGKCGPDAVLFSACKWRPVLFWPMDRLFKQTRGAGHER